MPPSSIDSLQGLVDRVCHDIGEEYAESKREFDEPKIIRDVIWGFYDLDPWFLVLIDSPFVQRLRYLSQTSLTYLTYPCSVHSRFEHSLGVWHVATRMIHAIERRRGIPIPQPYRVEIQLAALLHDTGHGPFSHSSEEVYRGCKVFSDLKVEDPDTFLDPSPSEVLAWSILRSPTFSKILDRVSGLVPHSDWVEPSLSPDRIGRMILGVKKGLPKGLEPLAPIVNGPFDADKLDYLTRDGYFTGLRVPVDLDRLLWGLDVVPAPDSAPNPGEELLVVHASSLSAVEQVLFSRAQMYTQIYQHHKVRAASQLLFRLFKLLQMEEGLPLDDPTTYLRLDESDILHTRWKSERVKEIVTRIRQRDLPMRGLVVTPECFYGLTDEEESADNWREERDFLLAHPDEQDKVGTYLAGSSGLRPEEVMIDIQFAPKLVGPGSAPIYFARNRVLPLKEVFPAEGWAHAHEAYRSATYFFTDSPNRSVRRQVGEATIRWLDGLGIHVTESAKTQAKLEP